MKLEAAILRAASAMVLTLLAGTWTIGQENPTYVRLVEESARYYHPSVVNELFTNRTARNQRANDVKKVCGGTKPLGEMQKEFDEWFKGYYYPLMSDPGQLPELAKLRRELMRDYFNRIKNETASLQVRDHLNKLTLDYMRKFAANNLHPAVRYNAMLIIGDLDARAEDTVGDRKPAEPMFEALEVLQTELTSPTQIDAVRVAALLGLQRHAKQNRLRPADKQWTEGQMTALSGKIGPIAAAQKPPAGRSVDGHVWMRRLSLETLAELAAARPMPAIATLIDRIISNPSEPLDLRIAAAKAQGMLKTPLPMGDKPAAAAERISRVAVDAIIIDLEELKHYLDKVERDALTNPPDPSAFPGGGLLGRDSGFGILEGESGTTKPEEEKVIRDPRVAMVQRRLKSRLVGVRQGLVGTDGVSGLAALGDKPVIEKMAAAITAIQTTLDQAPSGDPVPLEELKTFHATLSEKGAALEDLLPRAKPKEEPAPPGPAVEGPETEGPAVDGPLPDGPAVEPAGPAT
jgi:hypothetical protein